MHSLNNSDIERFDLTCAADFVRCWERFYEYRVEVFGGPQEIDYVNELNVGADLKPQNLTRLLRWKDPHRLTEQVMTGPNAGRRNAQVDRALWSLTALNQFRRGQIGEAEVRTAISSVFRTGAVFHVFLLHVAQPHVYPIADQHVFRAYGVHCQVTTRQTWTTYIGYRAYFAQIAQGIGVAQTPSNVHKLKRIDNALMAFGQFLKKYYRP